MATVTLYPSVGGFYNNISGWYPGEDWEWATTTSSSDGNANEVYEKYTTVGAGIGASDTINSVTWWIHITVSGDAFGVSSWTSYIDPLNSWGTLPLAVFHSQPSYSGVLSNAFAGGALPTGWYSMTLGTTNFPKSGEFNVSLIGQAASAGYIETRFDSTTLGGATKPYIVVDYTSASSSHLLSLTGVGK